MAKRERLEDDEEQNSYFTSAKKGLEFVTTGCTVLDCALGGGYVLGRMENIVGDKSTSKTGLATEALINFLMWCRKNGIAGHAAYRETEGAYDKAYAAAMGLPVDDIDFGDEDKPVVTIEAFAKDFIAFVAKCKKENVPGMYVLDSFDALSDEAELKRDISEGSYNMVKQKKVGEMFKRLVKTAEKARVTLIIVSQVRDNINAMYGEKHRRSGGKALDFYATHIFWLAHLKTLKRDVKKIKRAYGIKIKATVKKNKVGFPFREAEFDFLFGYGVDDVRSMLDWLKEVGRLKDADVASDISKYVKSMEDLSQKEYNRERNRLAKVVKQVWAEIETDFLPKRSKY